MDADLRCKRSDGKQWRCTAMSMPDKTVCEKHYIQAKKRAANSALRASLKKAKRRPSDSDPFLEEEEEEEEVEGTPQTHSPHTHFEDAWMPFNTPPLSGGPTRTLDPMPMPIPLMEYSDQTTDSSEEEQTCHQCRRNEKGRVVWCSRCDRRGYCDSCISTWYSTIPLEDIHKVCPACRGICNCKVCLRGDNMIKIRIREIPVLDKLQYLHSVLSSVLPVLKRIHHKQCSEVELEKRLRGTSIDLTRSKLNADEQMCCNLCRIPIIDYHRRCANCSYDLCLNCCQELREACECDAKGELSDNQIDWKNQIMETEKLRISKLKPYLSDTFSNWKANSDGSVPCPPKENGGCGYSSLNLSRIFKMNWVAKLVKNVEEMVNGCQIHEGGSLRTSLSSPRICQYAYREDSDDNFLYCPASEDIRTKGIGDFRKHWSKGEPVIVTHVFDRSSFLSWDPVVICKEVRETSDEKVKDGSKLVRAVDCLNWSEVDIELDQFIKGYSEGRSHENGWPELLKLKDWPSPSAAEEFLLFQRPEFISKLPLLEYIHSKWGLLNVAAKLPHYSLQNDVGPKILISYGTYEELGRGDSVTNLHCNMRDMVYLLVHTCELKLKGVQKTVNEKIEAPLRDSNEKELPGGPQRDTDKGASTDLPLGEMSMQNPSGERLDANKDKTLEDQDMETTSLEEITASCEQLNTNDENVSEDSHPGVLWDVFRRQDVAKLIEYMRMHWEEFAKPDGVIIDSVTRPLCEEAVFLNGDHKQKLKEEFSIEPWSFEQTMGQAVFIPTGCPFQVRNLQSNVQLGLDFLSPESMGEAERLAEEIRCLPTNHEAKPQAVEVGKISLYAASSAIKEVQKLVLDPKLGLELGFEDPNLTAIVSKNMDRPR